MNNVPYLTHESPDFGTQLSPWKQPRRSARLKAKKQTQNQTVETSNRFELLSIDPSPNPHPSTMSEPESPDHHRKNKRAQSITKSSISHNISDVSLYSNEKAILGKELNF